ncbi:MAG: hypothetical protein JO346_03620 [Alphaproteobacteria bacterium]|nr:hypothetical protein [Alphaproteobacteria bacterium]
MRRWLRWLGVAALVPVALAGMLGTVLANPEPFFAYHAERGRLALYSDRPFDVAKGQAILAAVEARLKTSPLYTDDANAIFVSNSDWRQRLFMNQAYGAGGVNFFPLTRNVFLRNANIDQDQLIRPNGTPAEVPRTLTYYAAHEIGHSLTGARLGVTHLWNWRLPQWVREGYADYVGLGGDVDVATLYARYRAHDSKFDFKKTGQYTLFRLLTAYFIQREHWSVDRLLTSGMSEQDAVARMNAGLSGKPAAI